MQKAINASVCLITLIVSIPIISVLSIWIFPNQDIWNYFLENLLLDLLVSSGILLIFVAIGVALLGTLLAYLVVFVEFPMRKFFSISLFLPFAIPSYVLGFIYLGIFDYSGYVQTFFREYFNITSFNFDLRSNSIPIILTFILAFYPYVYIIARASFMRQKISIIENARLLTKSNLAVFFKVAMPLIRPAIVAGVLVALMETLADFGLVSLFNYNAWTVAIYSAWYDFRSIEVAAQLSSLLIIVIFFLIYLEKFARNKGKHYSYAITNRRIYHPKGWRKYLIMFIPLFVFIFALAIPILQLIVWSTEVIFEELNYQYLNLLFSSFILIFISVSIILLLSLLLVLASNNRYLNFIIKFTTIGYALPGSIMVIGILFAITNISNINQYFGGASINHLFFSSISLLIFAYVARFITISYRSINSVKKQIKPVFVENAKLLNGKKSNIIFSIYIPMLKSGLLAGALLVSVDILKELPATYILRSIGWDTLAIKTFELSAEGLFQRASVPSLIMVLFGFFIIFLLQKFDYKY
jgi:iron(III) transport system permease protein